MGAPFDPSQSGADLADLWPPLSGLFGPASPQQWAWALAQYAQQRGGGAPALQGDGAPDWPGATPANQVWADAVQNVGRVFPGGTQDGTGQASPADASASPPPTAMAAADAPDQDEAPTAEAAQTEASDAQPAGPGSAAIPASSVASPAAAQVPINPSPTGGQVRLSASDFDPAGQSQRLSSGPDPLVWAIYHSKPQMIPPGYVVDPKTGAVSRWSLTPGGDPLHPANPVLTPLAPADKQRFLEQITGASERQFGAVSPQEGFQRSALNLSLTPGVPDWAKLRAPDTKEQGLLDFIAQKEGVDDATVHRKNFASAYDVPYGYGQPPKPLTRMTLGELESYQNALFQATGSTAVGKYQFLRSTLDTLKKSLHLRDQDVFTPELQDRLAREQLRSKGLEKFKAGQISAQDFQNGMSQTWDSLPKFGTGRSWYGHAPRATDAEVQHAIAGLAPQPASPTM